MKEKKFKLKKNYKYILISLGIIVFLNVSLTLAKFISSKIFNLGYNLVGVKYDGSNLVNSDVNLNPSRELLVNPYRGFYVLADIDLPLEGDDAAREELINHANHDVKEVSEKNLSLILLEVYLKNYKNEPLSEYAISALNDYVDVIRKAGYKIILRFAYGDTYEEGQNINNDPDSFDTILNHVDQLKDFFNQNKDTLHVVQLGFIGPWGEMHSSPYATTEYINQLVDKTLSVVPYPIQVSLRRPSYYREYIGNDAFFNERLGYTEAREARIGLFNDSFLSSSTDKGTYEKGERESELEWQSYLTKYLVMGGELSYRGDENGEYPGDSEELFFEIPEATKEMEQVHLNYLHDGHKIIEKFWQNTHLTTENDPLYAGLDAYTYFANKMGYRYLITNAKVPAGEVPKGSIINFEVTIKNEGFANLTHERNVYAILTKGDKYYKVITDKNPTTWWSGEETREEFVFKIPSNIQEGEWKIYLSLPDKYDEYAENDNAAIKFANEDGYLSQVLGNYVGTITVKGDADNNNNGFYQLNDADEKVEDNSPLYRYDRKITIDGILTDEYEWYESELIYDNGEVEIYAREDDEYIYLFGQAYNYDVFDYHFHIHFSKTGEDFYEYMIEDKNIYDGSFENKDGIGLVDGSGTPVEFAQQEYFEYKIPKARIGVNSLSDIKKLKVEYLDKSYDKKLSVDITEFKPSYAIVVDGMNTNNEWGEDDLVYQDDNSKIYARQEVGYLFVYIDTNLVTNMSNYYAYLYLAGASSTSPTNYNRTLTRNKIYNGYYKEIGEYEPSGVYDYMIDEGIEYKIHIRDIDAESISDIIGVSFVLRNKRTNAERMIFETEFNRSSFTGLKIDGYNNDWSEDYLYTKTDNYQVYLGNDRAFLYFYGDISNVEAIDYETIKVNFAIEGKSSSFKDYIYEMSNNELRANTRSETIGIITEYTKAQGVEFKISLNDLNIKSSEEIIGVRILYKKVNEEGITQDAFEYEMHQNKDSNIVVDGKNTEGEYDDFLLIDGSKYKIYGTSSDTTLYLYGEYKNITFADMYLYIATNSAPLGDYNYRISSTSSSIHEFADDTEGNTVSHNLTHEVTESSFEFSLPLKDIGISTVEELRGLKIRPRYLDSASEKVDYYREDIMLDDELILDGDKSEKNYKLLGTNSSFDVYGFSGKDYFYIYATTKETIFDNFQIYFATKTRLDYDYRIENSSLRKEGEVTEKLGNVLNVRNSPIVEYAVPLEKLGITSIDDLKSIRIVPLINGWSSAYKKDILDLKNNIIIDGEMSTPDEYPVETLVGDVDGVQLYMRDVDGFIAFLIKFNPEEFTLPRERYTIYMCTESGCSNTSRLARLESGVLRLLAGGTKNEDKTDFGYQVNPYIESVFKLSDLDFAMSDVKYFEVRLEDASHSDRKTVEIPVSTTFSGLNS